MSVGLERGRDDGEAQSLGLQADVSVHNATMQIAKCDQVSTIWMIKSLCEYESNTSSDPKYHVASNLLPAIVQPG